MKALRITLIVLASVVILGIVGCKNRDSIISDDTEFTTHPGITEETDPSVSEETSDTSETTLATEVSATATPTAAPDITSENQETERVPVETTQATNTGNGDNSEPVDQASQNVPAATATPMPTATTAPTATPTPIPTEIPEPTATPTPIPTPTPTIAPIYDPQYTSCIVDVGWEAGDDVNGYTSGVVTGVTARRTSNGNWVLTTESADAVAAAAYATGASGYSDWIIDGSHRNFS